jgi:hypothetical protein
LSWKQFPLTAGPVTVELLRDGQVTRRLESPEPVTDKPYREQHSMVCVSTEDDWHWKQDFGDAPPTPIQHGEYGDIDADGLPNWFEMYWFGQHVQDWSSATKADPEADPDGDGLTSLQEYMARMNPALKADYCPGFAWELLEVAENSSAAFNPENDKFDTPVWYFKNKSADSAPVAHGGYWMCERFGWHPDRLQAVYAPPYNASGGMFTRQWEQDGKKASGESMPLTPSRYRVSVGPYGLQALGWRSPVTGKVRFQTTGSVLVFMY